MGIDLRLLPCEHWSVHDGKTWGFSHTILHLGDIWEEAWDAFQQMVKPHLVTMPAGHDVSSYTGAIVPDGYHKGEKIYGTIREADGYGAPYTFVTAKDLLPWLAEHFQYDGGRGHGPYQTSIVAYVRALPPDTKIVLDWH